MLEPTVRSEGGPPDEPAATGSAATGSAATGSAASGSVRRAADEALELVERLPPLALMAVVAAVFELFLARIAWHGLYDIVDPTLLRELRRLARFPRTLAAVAGIVALIVALMSHLRLPGWAPVGRRLAVAAFSGVFVPAVVVATVLPAASLRRRLVIFGLAAANVLVVLLGMSAARYRPGRGVRVATVTATVTCFVALAVVGLGQLAHVDGPGALGGLGALFMAHASATQRVLMGMRHVGEIAWMVTPMAAAWTVAAKGPEAGRPGRIRALVALAVVLAGAVLGFQQLVGHRFRLALFGAFRLGLFTDDAPALYAIPLGVGAAGAVLALGRRSEALRQLGAAMILWLAAGYAPHTPIQLCYLVLGGMLLSRAAQGLDRTGAWRTHQPWARFVRRI